MPKLALLGGKKIRETPFPSHPVLGQKEKDRVLKVLETGLMSGFIATSGDVFYGGPNVRGLEDEFKEYFDVKQAVAMNSATAGLHAAVAALKIGPGDEVIVTPYTMCASASAVLMQGAIPVFADIKEDTFCIDPERIKEAITHSTKAILVVHLFGQSADMDEIISIAKENNLAVIEDVAQAPGATYKGKLLGTIGDVGVFSLNQHKTITTGEGGVAITNSDDLALRMQLVRNHGEVIVDDMGVEDVTNLLGWNYRMTELEAAVGIEQFRKLDFLTEHRTGLAEHLTKRLTGFHRGIAPPVTYQHNKHVYFVYPIRYEEDLIGIPRDLFVKAVVAEGIPFSAGYVKPIYLEPMYQKRICFGDKGCPFTCRFYESSVKYEKGMCPVTEMMHYEKLILTGLCRYPCRTEDIDDVIRAFEKVLENPEELLELES